MSLSNSVVDSSDIRNWSSVCQFLVVTRLFSLYSCSIFSISLPFLQTNNNQCKIRAFYRDNNESCSTPWLTTRSKDCICPESHHGLLFQCNDIAYIADKNVQVSYASFPHIYVEALYLKGSCSVNLNITISSFSSNLILCNWKRKTSRKRNTTKDSLSSFRSRLVSPFRSSSPLFEITRRKQEEQFSLPCEYLKRSRLNCSICNHVINRSSVV